MTDPRAQQLEEIYNDLIGAVAAAGIARLIPWALAAAVIERASYQVEVVEGIILNPRPTV